MSTDGTESNLDKSARDQRQSEEIERVRESLRGLKFGSVNVIVQDGVIVQIERTEKTRIRRSKPSISDTRASQ